jgi:N-acyl amino acid synthase of PEP-CTERM/exosortase system
VNSGESVGCIRLILPDRDQPSLPFPFEKTCGLSLDQHYLLTKERDQFTVAEVSPIVVAGRYRRRKAEQQSPGTISAQDFGSITRPRFPYIAVGLYLGILHTAKRNNIHTLYFLAERWLQEHFDNLGMHLTPIGQPVQRYNECIPCMLNVPETISNMSLFVRPLFKQISIEIDSYHWSHYKRRLLQGC